MIKLKQEKIISLDISKKPVLEGRYQCNDQISVLLFIGSHCSLDSVPDLMHTHWIIATDLYHISYFLLQIGIIPIPIQYHTKKLKS